VTRIYTRTGDDGTTGLIGGKRVPKDALRIEAYGAADELNSLLGLVVSCAPSQEVVRVLVRIQDELFTIGAELAAPGKRAGAHQGVSAIGDEAVASLEAEIDRCEAQLQPLKQFILPGGPLPAATLHVARTVARRLERRCISLHRSETLAPALLRYLNRLSDVLFVLARLVSAQSGYTEVHPTFGR
jgi:cob(I)alamin adenosyltransferase